MSMALKSSLDYYGYSCLCVHFISNSIMVTQLARHQTFTHFAFFFVNMTSFYKFCDGILVIVIESLIQWWFDVLLSLIKFLGAMVS
jgi:hypothetical protein